MDNLQYIDKMLECMALPGITAPPRTITMHVPDAILKEWTEYWHGKGYPLSDELKARMEQLGRVIN